MNELKQSPRDIKTQANKQLILDKTMELFNTKGYEQTTMADISKATGLSNGSVYHLFPNKSLILIEIYNYVFKNELGLNNDIDSKLEDPIHHIKEFIISYEEMWVNAGWYLPANIYRVSNKYNINGAVSTSVNDWNFTHRNELITFIKTAQAVGTLPKKNEPEFLANSIFLFGRGLLYEWSSSQGSYDFVSYSKKYWDMILPSILL